jgi:DNA-binding transcriptional MerR regulator
LTDTDATTETCIFVEILLLAKQTQIAFDFDDLPAAPVKKTRAAKKSPVVDQPKKGKRGRKSLKDMVSDAQMIELPPDEELLKKRYYSIGEVSTLFGLNPSSLRYWETEFVQLTPKKNKKGDRFYTVAEIKKLQLIFFLLRQRKFTIEGAKDYLKKHKDEATVRFELVQSLQQIKSFLQSLQADL